VASWSEGLRWVIGNGIRHGWGSVNDVVVLAIVCLFCEETHDAGED
jgi:hypothetical protein